MPSINILCSYKLREVNPQYTQRKRKVELLQHFKNIMLTIPIGERQGIKILKIKFSKMNTQTFDLNKMGLAPMDSSEMQEVEGGQVSSLWCLATKAAEYFGLADMANDLANGLVEGYNQTKK